MTLTAEESEFLNSLMDLDLEVNRSCSERGDEVSGKDKGLRWKGFTVTESSDTIIDMLSPFLKFSNEPVTNLLYNRYSTREIQRICEYQVQLDIPCARFNQEDINSSEFNGKSKKISEKLVLYKRIKEKQTCPIEENNYEIPVRRYNKICPRNWTKKYQPSQKDVVEKLQEVCHKQEVTNINPLATLDDIQHFDSRNVELDSISKQAIYEDKTIVCGTLSDSGLNYEQHLKNITTELEDTNIKSDFSQSDPQKSSTNLYAINNSSSEKKFPTKIKLTDSTQREIKNDLDYSEKITIPVVLPKIRKPSKELIEAVINRIASKTTTFGYQQQKSTGKTNSYTNNTEISLMDGCPCAASSVQQCRTQEVFRNYERLRTNGSKTPSHSYDRCKEIYLKRKRSPDNNQISKKTKISTTPNEKVIERQIPVTVLKVEPNKQYMMISITPSNQNTDQDPSGLSYNHSNLLTNSSNQMSSRYSTPTISKERQLQHFASSRSSDDDQHHQKSDSSPICITTKNNPLPEEKKNKIMEDLRIFIRMQVSRARKYYKSDIDWFQKMEPYVSDENLF